MLKILADNSIDSLEAIWKSKGIVAVIWTGKSVDNNIDYIKRRWYVGQYKNNLLDPIFESGGANLNAMPEIGLSKDMMQELLKADNITIKEDYSFPGSKRPPVILKNKISVSLSTSFSGITAPNVIGVIRGQDTSLPVVILSAHHDHDGKGVDGVYYGAVDNASGTVAIIEIARLLQQAVKRGLRTKRTIVFASFTGEERTELGSSYYVNYPLYPLSQTYGILNIDMMGRVDTFYSNKQVDSSYAYFLVKDTLHHFRKSLFDANTALNELTLDARYENPRYMRRRLEGSDQFPFMLKEFHSSE